MKAASMGKEDFLPCFGLEGRFPMKVLPLGLLIFGDCISSVAPE